MALWRGARRKRKRGGPRADVGGDGPLKARGGGWRPHGGAGPWPAAPAASGASLPSRPRGVVRSGGAALPASGQAGRGHRRRRHQRRGRRRTPCPAPAAAMLGLLVASLVVALAYFALLDGWYLVRVPCAVLRARLLQPRVRDLLAEQRYAGRVLPSDLDLLLHMNNARYLREADVARAAHLARCGVLGALRALGARAVLAASCARYRRSLRLFEPFEVRTRLLGWDDRAFYLEARFVSLRDGFVCALLRSRQHVLGTSPERVVQHLCKRRVSTSPPTPPLGPECTPPQGPQGSLSLSPLLGKASCLCLLGGAPVPLSGTSEYHSSPFVWIQGLPSLMPVFPGSTQGP